MAKCLATKFKHVTHCLFDLDGLLLESIYERIVQKIAKYHGKSYPLDVRMKILGTTDQKSAEIAINELKLPLTIEEYLKVYHEECKKQMINVPLMAGAKRLLCHLHTTKIPIALATSSSEPMVELKTAKHSELFKLFHHRVCGSTDPEVKQGKPAPDIFLIAAARFPDKPEPQNCLVFEDSPNGVIAANAAGMQTVMVPDPRLSVEVTKLATIVLSSLCDFKPEEFGLPPLDN